jgi:hypothetical protein
MLPPVPTLCNRTLFVPLAVLPPAEKGGTPTLLCPTFVVPQGEWTIVWNLVTLNPQRGADDPEPLQARFAAGKGILPIVGQELHTTISWAISPTQWAASIVNQIEKRVDAITYDVAIEYGDGNDAYESKKICHHDPTIVVSKDPIEPPPSGGQG